MSDLSQLTTSLAQIAAAGGPKFDPRYNLKTGIVSGNHDGTWGPSTPVGNRAYQPKACEDGVIAYAMELCDEYDNEWNTCDIRNMSSRFSVCVYRSDLLDKPLFLSHCTTRLAASIALIKAVAERVGVEDE